MFLAIAQRRKRLKLRNTTYQDLVKTLPPLLTTMLNVSIALLYICRHMKEPMNLQRFTFLMQTVIIIITSIFNNPPKTYKEWKRHALQNNFRKLSKILKIITNNFSMKWQKSVKNSGTLKCISISISK